MPEGKVWRIIGYRGQSDWDGPQDNNTEIDMIFDSRFTKEIVENLITYYWSKLYRCVCVKAHEIEVFNNGNS